MDKKPYAITSLLPEFDCKLTGVAVENQEMKFVEADEAWRHISLDTTVELKAGEDYVLARVGGEVLLLKVIARAKLPADS